MKTELTIFDYGFDADAHIFVRSLYYISGRPSVVIPEPLQFMAAGIGGINWCRGSWRADTPLWKLMDDNHHRRIN